MMQQLWANPIVKSTKTALIKLLNLIKYVFNQRLKSCFFIHLYLYQEVLVVRTFFFLWLDFFYIVFTLRIEHYQTEFDSDNDYLSVKMSTLTYSRQEQMWRLVSMHGKLLVTGNVWWRNFSKWIWNCKWC